jgi:methyl-accepting chemotaxis protein
MEVPVADINVERKAGPPVWMWILGLLLLALIIWAIFSMMGRDDRQVVAPVTDTAVAPIGTTERAAPVTTLSAEGEAFMRDCYLDEGQRVEEMGLDHRFTVNCFNNLAASIDELARQHGVTTGVTDHTQTIRDRMREIEQSPADATRHANWTREAAVAGASAMESVQQRAQTGGQQVQQMRQQAERIQGTELQQEQMTPLRSYFRSAGDALQSLAGRSV